MCAIQIASSIVPRYGFGFNAGHFGFGRNRVFFRQRVIPCERVVVVVYAKALVMGQSPYPQPARKPAWLVSARYAGGFKEFLLFGRHVYPAQIGASCR